MTYPMLKSDLKTLQKTPELQSVSFSISRIQRYMGIGYNRASHLVAAAIEKGILVRDLESEWLVKLTEQEQIMTFDEIINLEEAVTLVSKIFAEMEGGESVIVIIDADNLPNVKEAHIQQAFCKENGITTLYGKGIMTEDKTIYFFTTDRKIFAGYNGHTVVITSGESSEDAAVMAAGISIHKRWKQYVVYINPDLNNDTLESELTITEKLESIHECASMIPLHLTDDNSHANQHIKHFVEQIKLHCQHNGTKGE